jgi:hypothetical protein
MAALARVFPFQRARLGQSDAINKEGVDIDEGQQRSGFAQTQTAWRVLKGVLVPAVLSRREVSMGRCAERNRCRIVRYPERMLTFDRRSPAG